MAFGQLEILDEDRDGGAPKVIATGGLAPLIADAVRSIEHVNPDLKLHGLRLIYQRAQAH